MFKTLRIVLETAILKAKAKEKKRVEASLGAEALKKLPPSNEPCSGEKVAKEESLWHAALFADWSI